jgi:hypothetical protein
MDVKNTIKVEKRKRKGKDNSAKWVMNNIPHKQIYLHQKYITINQTNYRVSPQTYS